VDINSADKNGMTPILCSVASTSSPNIKIFSQLVEKGADVNVKNADGQSLIQTILINNITIDNDLKDIIEALNINFDDKENRNLLHEVILVRDHNNENDHNTKAIQSKVQALLQCGYAIDSRDKFGSTPLHIAAVRNNSNLALVLIKNGADVNAKDNNGATPLHDALEHNNFKESVLKVLIEAGADLNAKDIFGMTPQDVISPPNKNAKETFLREIIKQKEKEKK
jgi:ankyrin repeat protein